MFLLNNPIFTSEPAARRLTGFSYLGNVSHSAKLKKTQKYEHELTYGIYLAPYDLSGFQVCGGSTEHCRAACLNFSGMNKVFHKKNKIQLSRIKKTQMLHMYKTFMFDWICAEITRLKAKAERLGYGFSVRINCTSDLNLSMFKNSAGLNVFEVFPDVQFYDYTKIFHRIKLMQKYPNYDLTYSYNGLNWDKCLEALKLGVRIAMVFEGEMPKTYCGVPVVNGNTYDIRYIDPKYSIVGLSFKKVRAKIDFNNTPFVISLNDVNRGI